MRTKRNVREADGTVVFTFGAPTGGSALTLRAARASKKPAQKNWLVPRLNNFRQNVQPVGEFHAPDLIVSLTARCNAGDQLFAAVRNVGSAEVPAGVVVGFYQGTGGAQKRLGEDATGEALAPAESTVVSFKLKDVPAMGTLFVAVVDDGGPPHAWRECRPKNNESDPVPFTCGGPE